MIAFLKRKFGVETKEDLKRALWQFIKFGLVGLSNTAVSFAIYYIFLFINPALYLWGNVVGWVVSVFNSFFWNNKYVFQQKEQSWGLWFKRLGRNYLCYGASFLLGTALLYVQVQHLGISEALAPVLNLIVTIPLNFLLNKFWAFRN